MNTLANIITYVRRIIKSPSQDVITDALIIDYINRFWLMDVDARMQVFDLKTKYQFQTMPGVDQYNMPLYDFQVESPDTLPQTIGMYPVYQGFLSPAYINGVQVALETLKTPFFNAYPNVVQNLVGAGIGDGTSNYTLRLPVLSPNVPVTPQNPPIQAILRGHVDMSGIIATGSNQDPVFGTTLNTAIPSTSIYPAVYITSTDAYGNNVTVQDSGQFLLDGSGNRQPNYGLLISPGNAPFGYSAMPGGYVVSAAITGATNATLCVLTTTTTLAPGTLVTISGVNGMTELNGNTYTVVANTGTLLTISVDSTAFGVYTSGGTVNSINNVVNYLTGVINVSFPVNIPAGNQISVQVYYFQTGLPRGMLYYNNTLTLRSPPDRQYLVELDAYLTPAAFLVGSQAVPFAYMSEYIARGAARKILSDTGDVEQFMFYEQFFKEQELLVWKRSQRQWTNNRTPTIYSQGMNYGGRGTYGGGQI
jgi:hypothetical protein